MTTPKQKGLHRRKVGKRSAKTRFSNIIARIKR